MKKILIIFITAAVFNFCNAQIDYVGPSHILFNINSTSPTDTLNLPTYITSDFGPRYLEPPRASYDWHQGIDISPGAQDTDVGYRLRAINGGTIAKIGASTSQTNPLYYIAVDHINYDFGYVHIFPSNSTTIPVSSGGFTLVNTHHGPFQPDKYGIITPDSILLSDCDPCNGYFYVLGNDTIRAIDTIVANQYIAPLGDSGTGPGHLHLNYYEGIQDTWGYNDFVNGDDLALDPFTLIDHVGPQYEVTIHHDSINQVDSFPLGFSLEYPGTSTQKLMTRAKIPNEGNTSNYNSASLNISKVSFSIKNQSQDSFSLIQGPTYSSNILLGATSQDSLEYPLNVNNSGNLTGNWNRTGIMHFAYRDPGNAHPTPYTSQGGRPWDDYYFSDFVTRIHKDDPMDGGLAQIADCPEDSRYRDSRYDIFSEVTDVRDSIFRSDTLSFILDNWKPYVKEVVAFIGDSLVYDEDWTCNNDCVEFSNRNLNPELSGSDLENEMAITVLTSEPLTNLYLSISALGVDSMAFEPDTDSLRWDITIYSDSLVNSPNTISLQFTGNDVSGNQLISFPSSGTGDCFSIPTRSSDTTFIDNNAPDLTYGIDNIHGFNINCAATDTLKGGQQSSTRDDTYLTTISITSPEITTEKTVVHSYCHPECNNGSISIEVENEENYTIEWSTGDTKFNLANLGADIYAYTITDDACGYLEGEIEIVCNKIEIGFQTTPSCDNDGTIESTVSGGTSPYTFAWQDDVTETSSSRSGLNSNLYTLIVTDSNGCTNAASTFVKDVDPIILEDMGYTIYDAACNDDDGSISIYTPPSGGSAPFTYSWSNGSSGQSQFENGNVIYNLSAGSYSVTITDEEGCEAVANFAVLEADLPEIYIVTINHTCMGEEDGFIGLSPTSYEIEWSNGETGHILNNLGPGVYYCTVTDTDNECFIVESIEIEILNANSNPISVESESEANCTGLDVDNGKILLEVSGGIPPYTYNWSNGSTAKNILNLTKGDYTVTITDDCGLTGVFSEYVDATEIIVNSSWELNFGEITIDTDPDGGEAPYTYEWGNGESDQTIEVTEEGTYKITITDTNGCLVEEVIDISLNCTPLAIQLKTSTEGYDCNNSVLLSFDKVPGNSFLEGTAPFKVKIEMLVNQEWVTIENNTINSIGQLSQYQFISSTSGTFKATVLDNCGDVFEEVHKGCLDCNYEFYTGGGNNDEVYVDMFQGMITLEQVCPCDNDCDFGFTHDKIKLYVDENAIENSNLPWNLFNFTIIWPEGDPTTITKSWIGSQKKIKVQGPTKYVLSDDEFDNGIKVKVEYNLIQDNVLTLQCQTNIPFTFGQMGYNGSFFLYPNSNDNPFSSQGFELPYYLGTGVCSTDCEIPIESGVLYANQPLDYNDQLLDCAQDGQKNWFRFYPIDFADPCYGGGYLRTHIESNGNIYLNEIYIAPNEALAQTHWSGYLPLDDDGLFCEISTFNRGFCLFDGLDVYGVEVIYPLIAPYCDEEGFIPITDSDNDGIPDDEDPCPYIAGVLCNEGDEGEEDNPDLTTSDGCTILFEEEQCLINIVCPDGTTSTIYGEVTEEFHSGSDPCYHCFSANICRIPHPQGGPDFVSIQGQINDMLSTYMITDSDYCTECGFGFYCGAENTLLGVFCDDSCPPSAEIIVGKRCTYQENEIAFTFHDNQDDPSALKLDQHISKADALTIVKNSKRTQKTPIIQLQSIPNPSEGVFDLVFHTNSENSGILNIRNITGQAVVKKKLNFVKGYNKYSVHSALSPGLYYISISINDQIKQTIKHVVY